MTNFFKSIFGSSKYNKENLKEGEVWQYSTREGEENSTLLILKVEKQKGADLVHIAVNGLHINNPISPKGFTEEVGHLPFSKDAIRQSITRCVGENIKLPDFELGYNEWKQAFDNGKAGFWTIELKEAIKSMEAVLNKKSHSDTEAD